MLKIIISFLVTSLLLLANETDSTGTIMIDIDNFKNDQGKVRVSLFNSKDGFPEDYQKAVKYVNQEIFNKKARVIFENIPYGEYAIGFLHDENMDTKLNTNWLGMPKEGIAASNNAKGLFGPPSFEDSKFILETDSLKQKIKIDYF